MSKKTDGDHQAFVDAKRAARMSAAAYGELTGTDLMHLRVMFGNRQCVARREMRARVLSETIAELPSLNPQEVERYYDEMYDAETGNRRRA